MRKWMMGMLFLCLLVASFVAIQRYHIEEANKTVQLVLDYASCEAKARELGSTVSDLLLALPENEQLFVALGMRTLGEFLYYEKALPPRLQEYSSYTTISQRLLQPVAFFPEDVEEILGVSAGIVLRIPGDSPFPLEEITFPEASSLVIFSGFEVPGYKDKLLSTQDFLKEKGALVGSVEFAYQRGLSHVAHAGNTVRVHSISQEEMQRLTEERVVSRYVRAVRERNIRVLYLRFKEGGELSDSTAFLTSLMAALRDAGYEIGEAMPYESLSIPSVLQIFVYFGILIGSFLLLSFFAPLSPKHTLGLLFFLLLGVCLATFRFPVLLQQVMALLAALVFPVLGILTSMQLKTTGVMKYLLACAYSFMGALFVVGSLSSTDYLLKLLEFRGVKLMHILPPLILAIYGLLGQVLPLRQKRELGSKLLQLWELRIPFKLLVGLFFLGALGGIYVVRTGNVGFPVSSLEIALREGMERLLLLRPRTKEVFFGHPLLILGFFSYPKFSWWLVFGVVGQLSLVNTFTHAHTPLLVSLLRTLYGLVFGGILGFFLVRVHQRLKESSVYDYALRILRISKPRG